MAELNPSKVIHRVRERLQLSQESLARVLNATKGAIQHWERGRNNPDLARLLALREICPPGAERKDLDSLIKHTQSLVAPLPMGGAGSRLGADPKAHRLADVYAGQLNTHVLRREKARLERQVAKLEDTVRRKNEQVRLLEDLVKDLERELGSRRGQQPAAASALPPAQPVQS